LRSDASRSDREQSGGTALLKAGQGIKVKKKRGVRPHGGGNDPERQQVPAKTRSKRTGKS